MFHVPAHKNVEHPAGQIVNDPRVPFKIVNATAPKDPFNTNDSDALFFVTKVLNRLYETGVLDPRKSDGPRAHMAKVTARMLVRELASKTV
jgi:hypothetical protein